MKKTKIEVIHDDFTKWKANRRYHLVFADPPFNIKAEYNDYDDNLECGEYVTFTNQWLTKLIGCSMPSAVIALHGPDTLAELYLDLINPHQFKRIAWVNWHYRFGQCNRGNWIDARCHCLIYKAKGSKKFTWNPDAVLVESDRVKMKDKRIHETKNGGKRLPGTVWGVPSDGPFWGRVQGNNEERRKNHSNQLPEKYLERLILAYTNPGDWILDPFGGSGTTAVVAQALGRNCTTLDISPSSCQSIRERLKKGAVRV